MAEKGASIAFKVALTTKHEDKYEDKVDCMRHGEENHCSSKRRQQSDKDWVSPCSDMNPACSHNLCMYSDK